MKGKRGPTTNSIGSWISDDAMRSPEDREPRDAVEPKEEGHVLRYELLVRLAPPWGTHVLILRHYEDGTCTACYRKGTR